jgi:replicative DNA helicase
MTHLDQLAPPRQARFTAGSELFTVWGENVRSGKGPVLYRHAFPHPEVGPGLVTLIGGAPGGGKTAFTTMMGIEMLRFQPELRVLIANCEMSPEALLNRQLARLSGIDAEAVRHRRLGPEHEERLAVGLATLESVVNRLAFLNAPFDLGNVAATADAFGAKVIICDYIQRFTLPTEDHEARHRVNRIMDYLRQFAAQGVAVIVVSAVGRTKDKAGRSSYSGDGLSLASFRETSELEYGADDALIMAPISVDDPEVVQLSHLKARHGRQVTQEFRFIRSVQSFELLRSTEPGQQPRTAPLAEAARSAPRASVVTELQRLWDNNPAAPDDSVARPNSNSLPEDSAGAL